MKRLIEILLGIKPAPWAEGGAMRVEWASFPTGDAALLTLVSLALVIWMVWWCYRREGRGLSVGVRVMLWAMRLTVIFGVAAMLLEPVLVFSRKEFSPSRLLVLCDVSESMDLRDAWANTTRAQQVAQALNLPGGDKDLRERTRSELIDRVLQAKLLKALEADGDREVRVLPYAATLMPEAPATQPNAGTTKPASMPSDSTDAVTNGGRDATATGAAIRQAIGASRGKPLAGILLITEGQSNTGEPAQRAAELAKAEGLPIVILAAGTPEGPRSAKVMKIDVSPIVFVKDPNRLGVIVESRGMSGQGATLLLERRRDGGPWEEAGKQSLTLGESGSLQTMTFEFTEETPARVEFRATLSDAGPPLTPGDHLQMAEVKAINQRIKVLFIAGSSFPEVQFMRNALLRDKGVEMSSWLQGADANFKHPGTVASLNRLPANQEELNGYDCIVLYDPDPALLPDNWNEMAQSFVSQAGGGLIYVAGERMTKLNFERAADPTLAWLSMLPVIIEAGLFRSDVSVRISSREPWRLDITPEGRGDPIFQFTKTPDTNDRVLASLPGMFWHFPVSRAKPGATVLARHGDPRMRNQYGPEVLMATQLVGPGRTFFLAFDSTYRWRYLDEQHFDGFWARMIDRAGRNKQLGGRYPFTLTTDRQSYRPGSPIKLTARFINPNDAGAGLDSLKAELEAGDQSQPLVLTPKAGETGVYEVTFNAGRAGTHSVRVWSGDTPAPGSGSSATPTVTPSGTPVAPRAATIQIPVETPHIEVERPTQDRAALEAIARASAGGAVYDLDQADQVLAAFTTRKVANVLEDRQEIWNAPLLIGLILAALVGEWVLRKKYRMV